MRPQVLTPDLIESRSERVPFSGCWIWTWSSHERGYGHVRVRGKNQSAHRASWMIFRGDPGNLHVLHRCDIPACVNPDHLFLGTHQENMEDRERKGRNNPPPTSCRGSPRFNQRHRKLTDDQVREIMAAKAAIVRGGSTAKNLAEKHGVKVRLIYKIWNRDLWGHLWE